MIARSYFGEMFLPQSLYLIKDLMNPDRREFLSVIVNSMKHKDCKVNQRKKLLFALFDDSLYYSKENLSML